MNIKIIFIICILYLYGCSQSEKTSNTIINVTETADTIRLSEIFDTIEYIPLETREGIYINRSSKLLFYKNKFYTATDGGILIFNRNGEFLSSINNQGKGPHEYLSIVDYSISAEEDCLCLITRSNKYNIDKYDLSGNFLQRTPMDVFSFAAEVSGGELYSFNDGERDKCIDIIDLNSGKLTKSFLDVRGEADRPSPLMMSRYFNKTSDEIYFSRALSNIIYKVSPSGVVPEFSLDFGAKSFPEKELKRGKITDDDLMKYRKQYLWFETYTVTPKFLHFIYIDQAVKFGYYFFDNEKLLVSSNYKNDIVEGGFPPYRYSYSNNMVYCLVDSHEILSYFEMKFSEYTGEELNNLSEINPYVKMAIELKETDNPVIILAKCKEYE